MSSRRKHVTQDALTSHELPQEHERILCVVSLRGSNIVEAELPDATTTLVRIPSKFNKMLWVRAGSYILAQLGEADGKVNGELTRVLMADQVKYFKKIPGLWPPEFDDAATKLLKEAPPPPPQVKGDGSSDDDMPPIMEIDNRRKMTYAEDSSSDDDD